MKAVLSRPNVRRRWSLRRLLHVVLDLLSFGQALEAFAVDGRMMHEDILSAVARRDKAVALRVVKPLYCSCSHCNTSIDCDVLQFVSCEGDYGSGFRKTGGLPELTTTRTGLHAGNYTQGSKESYYFF